MKTKPLLLPYEAKIFSQHSEDGIIRTLLDFLKDPNKIAIEIGSGNGLQNMIRNLVANCGYTGIGHDLITSRWPHENYTHNVGLITIDNLDRVVAKWPTLAPDFFSLDIDSYDFWILKELLSKHNFRPSVMSIEYLCYYGSTTVCSVKSNLLSYTFKKCGASLSAYKKLLALYGYTFFTCDTQGVNSFFYYEPKLDNVNKLKELITHEWSFFTKYKYLQNINPNDPDLEFDENILLK
jgi:hypothetical protein